MTPLLAVLTFSGTLTGDFAAWGETEVLALPSRDFAAAPLATAPVAPDGTFRLDLPDGTSEMILALWPATGGIVPRLLREIPVAVDESGLEIPVGGPPQSRAERRAASSSGWWIGVGLLAVALLLALVGRMLLGRASRRSGHAGRWTIPAPRAPSDVRGTRWAWAIGIVGAGLLCYGLFALDEPLDLLEHTYYQEAFAGEDPLSVALSSVVAERAHAPGYAVVLWTLRQATTALWWLRLPAVLATLLGAWALFRLTVDGTGDARAGWIAAALGTLAPLTMRYGRDLTPYSLVGLLSVVSLWLFWRALARNDRRSWAAWAAVGVGAFFLHYFTAFLVVGEAVAGLWLLARGGGAFWIGRARAAVGAFLALAALPLVWGGQVVRAFVLSAQDNLVTSAVYPIAPDFGTYCVEHLRVLFGLPEALSWGVLPVLALLVWGYWALLRDHPAFGRVLLAPFVLVLGLLITTYTLHHWAYGGRIYYGWRWLRPYTAAVAIPLAWLAVSAAGRSRWVARGAVGLVLACVVGVGAAGAVERQRPASRTAAQIVRSQAADSDAIGVLPAAFYAPGLAWHLVGEDPKRAHPGPSRWAYLPNGQEDYSRIFGPLRTFVVPLESLAGHVDTRRLWVCVFDERLFGRPEFDPALPEDVLSQLDAAYGRVRSWKLPFMRLVLYRMPLPTLAEAGIRVDTQRLYRSLRWLPDALEPDTLMTVVRDAKPLKIRWPTGPREAKVTVNGIPESANEGDVRWERDTRLARTTLTLHRTEKALRWPIVVEIVP